MKEKAAARQSLIFMKRKSRELCKTIKKLVDDGIFPYDHKNFDPDRALLNAGKLIGNFAGGYMK